MAIRKTKLLRTLRDQFGHDAFRPAQEEIIRTLLNGRDVLALLPTGVGKSLMYQLTAQLLPGLTIVVSPLLALMQDQVDGLQQLGVGVAVINSAQTAAQAHQALEDVQHGNVKLLYVTPERFGNERFMRAMKRLDVSMLVVDEAHCVSDWGHSFRPVYLLLTRAVKSRWHRRKSAPWRWRSPLPQRPGYAKRSWIGSNCAIPSCWHAASTGPTYSSRCVALNKNATIAVYSMLF